MNILSTFLIRKVQNMFLRIKLVFFDHLNFNES